MNDREVAHYDNKELWKRLSLSESNRERIEKTVEMIPTVVKSIADIGCGSGLFLNYIKEHLEIHELIGVDFNKSAMKTLKTSKKVGNISSIPLEDDGYDLVSALEVLEHLDIKEFVQAKRELIRISKKYLLISVPFNQDLETEFVKCIKCKTKFNKSHHKSFFDEKRMKKLFQEEGYGVKNMEYVSKKNNYFLITFFVNFGRKRRGVKNSEGCICPVCGYGVKDAGEVVGYSTNKKNIQKEKTEKYKENMKTEKNKEKKKSTKKSMFTLLKTIWPKSYTYKWIVVLYEKGI